MNGLGILFVGLVAVLGRDVIKRRKPQPWLVIALALSVTLFVLRNKLGHFSEGFFIRHWR
ncbi:hypothetical protein AB7W43_21885 [Providencia rettgeri]